MFNIEVHLCYYCYYTFLLSGNMMSLLVFLSRSLRHQSWSVYLASLAVSDTGFLICLFFSWSDNIGFSVYHQHGWCQTLVYMTYVCCFLSVWYIVCFTVERYIVVRCPLKRSQICTTKRAIMIVVFFAVFAFVFYSYAIWTSSLRPMYGRQEFCMPKEEYINLITILSYMDTAITLIIPTILIVLLNTLIVYTVSHYHKQRHTMTSSDSAPLHQSRLNTDNHDDSTNTYEMVSSKAHTHRLVRQSTTSSAQRTLTHMTRMLIVVSTSFVLLNLPSHSIRIYTFFMALYDFQYRASHALVSCQKLFQYIYYINFGINFVLYAACGSQIRNAMANLFTKTPCQPCVSKCVPSGATVNNSKHTRTLSMASKTTIPRISVV